MFHVPYIDRSISNGFFEQFETLETLEMKDGNRLLGFAFLGILSREFDELGPRILHRVSSSEYPEGAIDPDGSGEGKGEESKERDEDKEWHCVHSMAGLLKQMDH